uniref:Uncharacterized protein n=1 Tax=Anguilla anguilla TaxID=7936 RepID=A0A0E9T2A8_ANGAN
MTEQLPMKEKSSSENIKGVFAFFSEANLKGEISEWCFIHYDADRETTACR